MIGKSGLSGFMTSWILSQHEPYYLSDLLTGLGRAQAHGNTTYRAARRSLHSLFVFNCNLL